MAMHATAEGHDDPESITKPWMQRYLLRQQAERKQAGYGTLYNTMRLFWQFYAEEYDTTSPMLGIPRPRVGVAPVPVLTP